MSSQGNIPPERKSVLQIFGYEEGNGLWENPEYFNRERHGTSFITWRQKKRSFSRNEIDNSRWIFIPEQGKAWLMDFLPDGKVRSVRLFRTDKVFQGDYRVLDSGQFIMDSGHNNINILQIDLPQQNHLLTPIQLFVVKNREGTNRESLHHSGI